MNLTTSQIISKSFRDLFQKEIRNIILILKCLTLILLIFLLMKSFVNSKEINLSDKIYSNSFNF